MTIPQTGDTLVSFEHTYGDPKALLLCVYCGDTTVPIMTRHQIKPHWVPEESVPRDNVVFFFFFKIEMVVY